MATLFGIDADCIVTLSYRDNSGRLQFIRLAGRQFSLNMKHKPIDISGFGEPPQYVAGDSEAHLTLRNCHDIHCSRSTAESMALAVLDGDTAAARMLADLVCEDIIATDAGGESREQILADRTRLRRLLAEARDLLELLEWGSDASGSCPSCGSIYEPRGEHYDNCQLKAILKEPLS